MSQQPRWSDAFQRIRGQQPYRCRKCRLRFYAPDLSDLNVSPVAQPHSVHRSALHTRARNRRRTVRRLITIAIFTLMFAIFWFYLRYITADRTPADNSGVLWPLSTIGLVESS